jgi:hypothetical protein
VEATDLEAHPKETEAIVEQQEIPKEEAVIHLLRAWRQETMACQETMEAHLESKEPTSEDMESIAEDQKASKEEAAVRSSGALKKEHRGWHLAAGRRGKPKERTWGNCGSRRKLAATRRRFTCRAGWHDARETSSGKIGPWSRWNEEPRKD